MQPDESQGKQEIVKTGTLSNPERLIDGFGRQPSRYTELKERGEQLHLESARIEMPINHKTTGSG
jgi:hypothetical protein